MGDNYELPQEAANRLARVTTALQVGLQEYLGVRVYNEWVKATETLIDIERQIEQSPTLHALAMEQRRLGMLASQAGVRISDIPQERISKRLRGQKS